MTKTLTLLFLHSVLLASSQAFQAPALTRTSTLQSLQRSFEVSKQQPTTCSRSTVLVLSLNDDEELPKFSSDIVDDDDDNKDSKSKSNSNNNSNKKKESSSSSEGGLLVQLDEFGQSLKPKAQQVNLKAGQSTKRRSQILLKLKACLYYTLYMGYRGYRGFFVILPAVFREVYSKMETAVDFRVLDDDETDNATSTTSFLLSKTPGDVNPSTGKVRWRTKITVSVLAALVTMTYVVGGLARVLVKFLKTILSTSSLSGSFSAAAEEVEGNEGRLMRLSGGKNNDNDNSNDDKGNNNSINGGRRSQEDLGF